MKRRHSWSAYFTGGLLVALAVGAALWGAQISAMLKNGLQPETKEAQRAERNARPAARAPLAAQIAACRKRGASYQACMYQAGYAVNAEWATAHNKEAGEKAVAKDFSRAIDAVGDAYRAGASPVYGVPYWVPKGSVR